MKKYILPLVLIFSIQTIAQNELQNAIQFNAWSEAQLAINKVKINPDSTNVEQIIAVFSAFYDLSSANTNEEAITLIQAQLDGSGREGVKNPYISMSTLVQETNIGTFDASSLASAKSLGGLDVTNLALGLTDFLIKRAKTELNTAFFKRFRKDLNNDKNKALAMLFPKTLQLLNLIDVEIYQYDLYLNNMRAAFQEDLDAIDRQLPELLLHYKSDIDKLGNGVYELTALGLKGAELQKSGYIGASLAGQLLRDQSYQDVINAFPGASNAPKTDALNALLFLNLLAESFSEKEGDGKYLPSIALKHLENENTLKLYLGLLFETARKAPYNKIAFSGNLNTVDAILGEIAKKGDQFTAFKSYAQKITDQLNSIEKAYHQISKLKSDLSLNDVLSQKQKNFKIYTASHQLFTELIELFRLAEKANTTLGYAAPMAEVNKIIQTIEDIGDLSAAVLHKQYAQVVTKTAFLLNEVLKKNEEVGEVTAKVLRYGTFMAALVESESPEAAQNAIDAAALPPGSYSIKRETAFSVALNGYLGGFYGNEDIGNDGGTGGFNNLAVTAPVGISLSFGNICRSWANPWSIGMSLPIVDLGTVASYRLDSDNNAVEDIPSIKLEHLLAPGAFAEIGIGGTPLTLGMGMQYGARLREIEAGGNSNVLGDTYFRYGFSLKVDIPLMQFVAIPGKRTVNKPD